MTVHFFYNYKDALVKELTGNYEEALEELAKERQQQAQLDQVQQIIEDYFKSLGTQLTDVMVVSDGRITLEEGDDYLYKFHIQENYIKLTRREKHIEIKIGVYSRDTELVEATIVAYVVPGDKRAVVRKVGKIHDRNHFDENTLNYYMRRAFHDLYPIEQKV